MEQKYPTVERARETREQGDPARKSLQFISIKRGKVQRGREALPSKRPKSGQTTWKRPLREQVNDFN